MVIVKFGYFLVDVNLFHSKTYHAFIAKIFFCSSVVFQESFMKMDYNDLC